MSEKEREYTKLQSTQSLPLNTTDFFLGSGSIEFLTYLSGKCGGGGGRKGVLGSGGGGDAGWWRHSSASASSSSSSLTRIQRRQVFIQGIFLVLGLVLLAGLSASIYVAGEEHVALWSGTNKNRDISAGLLARPFAHLLAPLTSLTPSIVGK